MTIPWMMNCAHSDTGWCLQCVAELGAEVEMLKAKDTPDSIIFRLRQFLDDYRVLQAHNDDLSHRMCQIQDALDELRKGCPPENWDYYFLAWSPEGKGPYSLPPSCVRGFYEAYAAKIRDLGDWSRLRSAENAVASIELETQYERESYRHLREMFGARPTETTVDFVSRLYSEREEARAALAKLEKRARLSTQEWVECMTRERKKKQEKKPAKKPAKKRKK